MPNRLSNARNYNVAEFFAGIGLVRKGLEAAGFRVVYANDIDDKKREIYSLNFAAAEYVLADVTNPAIVHGSSVPDVDVATASFPCTDLSLAGNRAGLRGTQSGAFWGFIRVLDEMGHRRPSVVLLENVPSLATSHRGADLISILEALNALGYACDVLELDARMFLPQSRRRLFIVGLLDAVPSTSPPDVSWARPSWLSRLAWTHPELKFHWRRIDQPMPTSSVRLSDCLEALPHGDERWWSRDRVDAFLRSLAPLHSARALEMSQSARIVHATAYRRTRKQVATWEIRSDEVAGCLRTARGGSSKQALVEAGGGELRIRWLTGREYAALQGAHELQLHGIPENQVLFGLGDAVCVPVLEWLGRYYLRPALNEIEARHVGGAECQMSRSRINLGIASPAPAR